MRRKIQELLDSGKSSEDVIQYELATYPGQSALVVPLDKGFNRVAWALPYAVLLLGVGGLVVVGRSWSRKPTTPTTPEAPSAEPVGSDAYAARLQDELDELD
jgi:cytochrome c-type biogenesis protein CcmH/NrfF